MKSTGILQLAAVLAVAQPSREARQRPLHVRLVRHPEQQDPRALDRQARVVQRSRRDERRLEPGLGLGIGVVGSLLAGCGTAWRVEYDNPQYGNAALEVTLPKKEGYAK